MQTSIASMPRGAIYRLSPVIIDAERKRLSTASSEIHFGFGAWKMNVLVDHIPPIIM